MNTENVNPRSKNFDEKSTIEMLRIINNEDKTVADAVEKALPQIAEAVDVIAEGIKKGGRIIYVGAGTSGRLAVQDAAECTVTYGVKPGTVTAVMAGGKEAVFSPSENIEDNYETGFSDINDFNLTPYDSVVGISASGNADYVCGAIDAAGKAGANTVAILCNTHGKIADSAQFSICVPTGAEVICGSTRMKAGTAQKMILNMLSTITMVKLGRVHGNFMTWMSPTNKKLEKRAKFIISQLCNVSEEVAGKLLAENNNEIHKVVENFEIKGRKNYD